VTAERPSFGKAHDGRESDRAVFKHLRIRRNGCFNEEPSLILARFWLRIQFLVGDIELWFLSNVRLHFILICGHGSRVQTAASGG
jgi:hypothetical protein